MDLLEVLIPFWDFLERYFGVSVTLGGFSFTVGAFLIWCILAMLLIGFVKGLAD